jgi:hypothetical protein
MFVNITKSTRAGKKMMAIFYDMNKKKVKTTHFGASGYESYPDHQDLQRKMNYITRHKAREDFNDYMTAGALSYWILWNKPTLSGSIEDYMNRFKLKKY